jgi:nicotinamide mononucleotide transporter
MRIAAYTFATLVSGFLIFASYRKLLPITLSETFGFLTGLLSVWLVVRENVWNWPVGIVNSVFFVFVFWHARLFADMSLQFLYVALGFLGWYQWLYGGEQKSALHISSIKWPLVAILSLVGLAATAGMTLYLRSVHDSSPFLDALTTVLSLIAQFLLTKKILQNWYVWMTADVLYIGLYLYKGLALTSLLYLVFLSLCCLGWKEWRTTFLALPSSPRIQPLFSPK